MTIYGIDVSSYQKPGDYDLAGRSFLIAKASEGALPDPSFGAHIGKAKVGGLVTGAYCYNRADLNIDNQVDTFAKVAAGKVDLYALDVEEESVGGTQMFTAAQAKMFMSRWRVKTGLPIGLYVSESPYYSGGYGSSGFDWLWIAHYGLPAGVKPKAPYDIWQYTSSGGLDKDRFEGTRDELLALGDPSAPPTDVEVPMGLQFQFRDYVSGVATVQGDGHAIIRVDNAGFVAAPAGQKRAVAARVVLTQPVPGHEASIPAGTEAYLVGNIPGNVPDNSQAAILLVRDCTFVRNSADCTAEVAAAISADRAKAHIVYS